MMTLSLLRKVALLVCLSPVIYGCANFESIHSDLSGVYLTDRSQVGWYKQGVRGGFLDPLALAAQFTSSDPFLNGAYGTAYPCSSPNKEDQFRMFVLEHQDRNDNGSNTGPNTFIVLIDLAHLGENAIGNQKTYLAYSQDDICFFVGESGSYLPRHTNVMRITRDTIQKALKRGVRSLDPAFS